MKVAESVLRDVVGARFELDVSQLEFVQDEADDIWWAQTVDGAEYVVRVVDPHSRPMTDVDRRADFLEAMTAAGCPVPTLRRTVAGTARCDVASPYRVEVSTWSAGTPITHWTADWAHQAGSALAQFSVLSGSVAVNATDGLSYTPGAVWQRGRNILSADPRWLAILDSLQPNVSRLDRLVSLNVQGIHGDVHRENFIADHTGMVTMIDVADMGYGPAWYDVAAAFSSVTQLDDGRLTRAFVTGYVSVDPFGLPDAESMSVLMAVRDVAIASYLVAANVRRDWVPERLARLVEDCEVVAVSGDHVAGSAYRAACRGY